MANPWLTAIEGGIDLHLHIVPRASRTRVVGVHGDRLKVQLAAPPVDGAANLALIEFLADLLGVRKSALTLVDGQSGRKKRVRVLGVDAKRAEAVISVQ